MASAKSSDGQHRDTEHCSLLDKFIHGKLFIKHLAIFSAGGMWQEAINATDSRSKRLQQPLADRVDLAFYPLIDQLQSHRDSLTRREGIHEGCCFPLQDVASRIIASLPGTALPYATAPQ